MSSFALRRALFAAAFVALAPAAGSAQNATPAPTPTSAVAPEIVRVVTSDRSAEAAGSSARTTFVVGKAEMLQHGYRTVADAIADLPGVNLVRYGPGGGNASVGIRGSSSAQVLVLVDGTPAGGAQILDVDLAAIPTSGVERIEVVEGGGSTLYGSGSIGGVINIITTPLSGTVIDARTGSFGENGLRVQMPNVSFERAVGNENYHLPDGTSRVNADYGLTVGRIAYDAKLGSTSARFSAGVTDRHQGVPGGTPFFLSPTSRQDDVSRDARLTFAQAHGSATTTLELAGTSVNLKYSCNTPVDTNCPDAYLGPGTPSYQQLLKESRVQASLRETLEGAASRTILGLDISRGTTRIDSGTPFDPLEFHSFAQSAAYVQQNWSSGRGNGVYAGLRGERDGSQGGAFSPSFGGTLRLSSQLTLRANAATAFRAPTAEDLYYPGFSTPTLVPERTRVADLTLEDHGVLGGVNLGWFITTGNNLIVFDPVSFTPQNIGHAAIAGFTFSAKTRVVRGTYAKLDLTDLYRAENLDTQSRIAGRGPVLQGTLELGYLGSPGTAIESAGVDVRNAGDRGFVDHTAPLFDQPVAYSRIDAFLRWRAGSRSLVTLRAYNLGNERYAEIGGYPMPGRTFSLEFSTK
ncbi:MAG: TonB-dependent receptor [Candidatus Eremiobacteraeota bacterium]|nr:TonB-dependent receptor [Candidatus Eremiobacteraeota bacterium]